MLLITKIIKIAPITKITNIFLLLKWLLCLDYNFNFKLSQLQNFKLSQL